jgi:hypothetical protein
LELLIIYLLKGNSIVRPRGREVKSGYYLACFACWSTPNRKCFVNFACETHNAFPVSLQMRTLLIYDESFGLARQA